MLFFTYNPEFLGIFHYTNLNSTLKLRFARKCFKTLIPFKYLDNQRDNSLKHMDEEKNLNGLRLKIHFFCLRQNRNRFKLLVILLQRSHRVAG